MDARRNLFEQTLENPFRIEQFVKFSLEFFKNLSMVNPDKQINDYWNWTEFGFHIAGYYHIANFLGNDSKKIAVFAVQLKDYRNLDRARSLQRNFVKRLMSSAQLDGAFVAFYADGETKWRLSFIKLDYEFNMGKVSEKITPAKRYSYLVGKGEPCHTAMERLFPIFVNEETNPSIAEIEEAFSVESVTKEFFEKYESKYSKLKEHLDQNPDFVNEAERLLFTSEQFAKKLMGQIAFLYFIQKKGWLGVNAFPRTQTPYTKKEYEKHFWALGKKSREVVPKIFVQAGEDEYVLHPERIKELPQEEQETLAAIFKGQTWGTGPRNFIRKLYNVCVKNGENFYDDYLEPLFYEALNKKRGANDYYHKLNCRIPFLNGGLFEPLENYDWQTNDFAIHNDMFSNVEVKGRYEADGILDIFDRYNFTMNEDEPLEKEVAVDPEMLGKVFENLLDTKDRKSKGAFYTPREIVHYMCQESLVNYLVSKTGISYDAIKDFIIYGEFMKDEDTTDEARKKRELYISDEILNPDRTINRLNDIDDALAGIKVADPAVGSGAFPLGMISEIVRARRNITEYLAMIIEETTASDKQADYHIRMMHETDRHPLTLKLHTIKNSIFAVDIEPSAVDIAKLRLWLSLVVEQEINENNDDDGIYAESRNPRPLPNLDCNIRCGNSLIDELDGIKLINESDLLGQSQFQTVIGQSQYDSLLNQLFEAQDKLFYEKNHDEKETLKKKIRAITDTIVMFSIKENPELVEKYNSLKNVPSPPFFLWQLEFARVFRYNGGFDVVIGNPPYGLINKKQNKHSSISATDVEQKYYKNAPLYQPAKGGMLNIYRLFVCLSHNLLKEHGNYSLIFPMAYMCDLSASNLRKFTFLNAKILYIEAFPERDNENKRVFEAVKMSVCILGVEKTKPQDTDVFRLRMNGDRFVDSCNPITYVPVNSIRQIDPNGMAIPIATQEELGLFIKMTTDSKRLGDISKCFTGEIDLSLDKEYVTDDPSEGTLIRGAQVQRYLITNEISQGEIIYILKEKYLACVNSPRSKHHIVRRILMQGITGVNEIIRLKMTLVDEGAFCANSVNYVLAPDSEVTTIEYLLGLLNSRLINWFFAKLSTNSNVNGYEVDNLPIRIGRYEKDIALLAKQITDEKKIDLSKDTSTRETEIDRMVYELYGLTEDEIRVVEGAVR